MGVHGVLVRLREWLDDLPCREPWRPQRGRGPQGYGVLRLDRACSVAWCFSGHPTALSASIKQGAMLWRSARTRRTRSTRPPPGPGRAAAFLHGLRQGLRRGTTGVVGELHAIWVSDYQ